MIAYIRRNWQVILLWMVFAIIIIVFVSSFFGNHASSGLGTGIWVFLFVGLIALAAFSRHHPYLALSFVALAVLIFLVILGKFDTLFEWAIVGLPIFAAIGFYGSTKVEGGAKTFLGFASAIIVIFWMYLFYQDGHQIANIHPFFKDVYDTLFPTGDNIAKTIFVIFLGLGGLALWKKSWIFGIMAFLVFLSLLGKSILIPMFDRLPSPNFSNGSSIINGISAYVGQSSAQKASELRERVVKNGSTFYEYNGTNFAKKDVSANEEFIKVFLLGESVQKDGLTFEKIRIGDPATGEDAWVYSGILLSSPTAAKSTAPGKAPEWEMVKECSIPLSGRIYSDTVGPNGERAHTGEVYSGCFVEMGYDYKITYSGEYSQWFTSDPWFNGLTWKGWNPQSQIIGKPFSELNYGALVLRIGNKECLHPEGKKDFIIFTPSQDAKIFSELNIDRDKSEYHHPKVGSKIKNSTLSIKIERRPL